MPVQQHVLNWLYSVLTSVSISTLLIFIFSILHKSRPSCCAAPNIANTPHLTSSSAGISRRQPHLQRRCHRPRAISNPRSSNRCTQYDCACPIIFDFLRLTIRLTAFPNGASALLLHLTGTLPVLFRGNTYRFPVSIWVPHTYPREAPLVYVTPTETMMVRPGQHVDPQGQVYHPYLAGWGDFWDVGHSQQAAVLLHSMSIEVTGTNGLSAEIKPQ